MLRGKIRHFRARRASTVIEYMVVIFFILAAFFIFQHYILRGLSGRWKSVGDVFGHGKQYDPRDFGEDGKGGGTFECYFDYTHCDPDQLPPDCNDPESRDCDPKDCPDQEQKIYQWADKRCYDENCDCFSATNNTDYIANCLECIKDCVTAGADICQY